MNNNFEKVMKLQTPENDDAPWVYEKLICPRCNKLVADK